MTVFLVVMALLCGGHHHRYQCYHRSGNVACYFNIHEHHITLYCKPWHGRHLRCVQTR